MTQTMDPRSGADDLVQDMLRFLIRWSPFDDGDDEILRPSESSHACSTYGWLG